MTNITLTTEQAQQIEEALEDIVRVFEFETGTPVEALATIRAARAQEQEPVCKRCNGTKIVPDGKMYSVDGFQLEVPIECVKDCPDCTAPQPVKQEPVAIDGLARACNLAGIDYKDFLRIKAYLPIAAPVRTKDMTVTPENGELERLHDYID